MNDIISINEISIAPGENRVVNLNEYYLPTGALIEIPTHVFRSKRKGPVIFFTAGVHGEEINGVEILRTSLRSGILEKLLCGTVIVIPVVNVMAFLNRKRDLPDGRDLNRCFPGTMKGSMGSRIAHDLMRYIVKQADFGFDFHTGGAEINNYPQLRCSYKDKKSLELATIFGAPFIVDSPYREKSFRQEAANAGVPVIVYEAGESGRFNTTGINEGIYGYLRVLKYFKMIASADREIPPPKTIFIKKDTWIRAQMSGLFRTSKRYGTYVEKNQVIGVTGDPYGKTEIELKAPENCFIIGINNQPVVNEGDALLHLGMEK